MTPPLGIIEGFYGPLWQWQEREALVRTLAPAGYRFYLYAPKGDAFLRKRWQEPHPESTATAIRAFGHFCRQQGLAFGVGLSPYELFNDFNTDSQQALAQKLLALDSLEIDWLAILFDDMHSQHPELAAEQGRIMHWVQAHSQAKRLLMCPTYYSDDPVLDRVFGQRPANYLEGLGQALPAGVDVFWTGEEVCAREISPGHLRRVTHQLGRKPVLWDNYPVNDGDRMSRHLHLRGFTGRPAANAGWLSGHAINPALQPTLTAIPALTLAQSYQQGEDYQYGQSFLQAAKQTLGAALAHQLQADLLLLQDSGLHRLSDERKARLQATYAGFDHPAAREVQAWLTGAYQVTDEMVQTQ
ncbi:MAG: beta-N-acetylglucosaminidase domain-containing protein [Marinobacter sp.]|nr:beta-N-acetylglucosaminidase domain-containing protein [Marinobacter sp.]